jgi:hypothetical protein
LSERSSGNAAGLEEEFVRGSITAGILRLSFRLGKRLKREILSSEIFPKLKIQEKVSDFP